MENASKALIIAGAILISILLISIGIIVMNTINQPLDEAGRQADSQAIEMFNSKFTNYSGTQNAAGVKALMTAIQSNNGSGTRQITAGSQTYTAAQTGSSAYNLIAGVTGSTVNNVGIIQSRVNNRNEYFVEFVYTNGFITHVWVATRTP